MADNDRLANGGQLGMSPGWKADADVRPDTPMVTQTLQGIGWQTSGESRLVVTKNAAGLPGWRARIFVPENLAQITLGTTNVVVTDEFDYIIPSGSYIEKGTEVRLHPNLGDTIARGCRATVQRQDTTDLNFWLTNYVDSHNNGHTFKTWVVNEDTHIISDARNRATATFASGVDGVIAATISGTSWGPRGTQSASLNLTAQFQNITNLEFFEGDLLNTSYAVDPEYDWADFTAGPDPQAAEVTPTTVHSSGGTYNFVMDYTVTYIAMTALASTSFFLNQPNSSVFTNTRVTVAEVPSVRIHKTGITLPLAGATIDYGKNGATGNHPRLYSGTRLTLTVTSNNTYIASNLVTSTDTTTPNPGVPTDTDGYSSVSFTMGGTPIFAVGLYYIKTGLTQTARTISKNNVTESYATFEADPNGRLNDQLTVGVSANWTLPSGAVAAWLQDASWTFNQTGMRGIGPGPTQSVQYPATRSGSSIGENGLVQTDSIENGLFTFAWSGVVNNYVPGQNFSLNMGAQIMNYTVGPPSGWLLNFGTVNVIWTFTPILIAAVNAA